jgi:hypothetical protein
MPSASVWPKSTPGLEPVCDRRAQSRRSPFALQLPRGWMSGPIMDRRAFMLSAGLAGFGGLSSATSGATCLANGSLAGLRRFLLQRCFRDLIVTDRPTGTVGASGAVRQNIDGPLVLQEQAAGFDWVRYGLLHDDAAAVRTGWKALDWGLRQQRPDGGFASEDAVHQTSWFLEKLAATFALDPTGLTAARRAGLARGLVWLDQPERRAHAVRNNAIFTHRCWMRASLFQAGALILNRADYAARARENVAQALAQQRGGAFPERGGPDVGYQILGLQYLQRWLALQPGGNLAARGERSMEQALRWYLARTGESGIVDRAGSTRMRIEAKDVRYARAVEVFVGASLLTGDSRWLRAGVLLQRGAIAERQAAASDIKRFDADAAGVPSRRIIAECAMCRDIR